MIECSILYILHGNQSLNTGKLHDIHVTNIASYYHCYITSNSAYLISSHICFTPKKSVQSVSIQELTLCKSRPGQLMSQWQPSTNAVNVDIDGETEAWSIQWIDGWWHSPHLAKDSSTNIKNVSVVTCSMNGQCRTCVWSQIQNFQTKQVTLLTPKLGDIYSLLRLETLGQYIKLKRLTRESTLLL